MGSSKPVIHTINVTIPKSFKSSVLIFSFCFGSNKKQDVRLAPAYFSPNYNYFDELLQTVENKTTVLILIFSFYKHQFHHWFLNFVQKGIVIFCWKNFRLTVPKNLVGEFKVSLISGIEKFYASEGYVTVFCRFLFVSQCRKISWAYLQCFRKVGLSKNFMLNRGYHKFPSKNFCLTLPKNFVGTPPMFQKIWGIEKFYA